MRRLSVLRRASRFSRHIFPRLERKKRGTHSFTVYFLQDKRSIETGLIYSCFEPFEVQIRTFDNFCVYFIFYISLGSQFWRENRRIQVGNLVKAATYDNQMAAPSAREALTGIFRCSICFSTAPLPAAACPKCFAIIGCIPCIEKWIAVTPTLSKCPLCRTSRHYAIIPMVRGLACILGQDVPDSDRG